MKKVTIEFEIEIPEDYSEEGLKEDLFITITNFLKTYKFYFKMLEMIIK